LRDLGLMTRLDCGQAGEPQNRVLTFDISSSPKGQN
jgi:hypothetical protein